MNNNRYSQINCPDLKKFKKLYNKDKQKVNKYLIEQSIKLAADIDNHVSGTLLLQLYRNMLNKNYINFYINDESLSKFFIETNIDEKTILNVSNLMCANDKNYTEGVISDNTNNQNNQKFYSDKAYSISGVIHQKTLKYSTMFQIMIAVKNDSVYSGNCIIVNGLNNKIGGEIIYKNEVIKEFYKTFEHDKDIKNITNLVLNMLFYMDAFPDKILDSPPDECIDKLNCNNSKTITMSDEIRDYLHENRDISPHLRRGHFRYLASDFYKNKKGQTIFVKSSFVKGHAKTIIE